jgi:CheY-like chemotaxis protein
VILMSGVVNKSVAEKAMAVKADELIRKPFQPQDLIARVKNLLLPKSKEVSRVDAAPADSVDAPRFSSQVLTSLFSVSTPGTAPPSSPSAAASRPSAPVMSAPSRPTAPPLAPVRPASPSISQAELQKLKNEIVRLELLVKKLQAELEAEHQYCAALETHFKSLQQS